MMNTDGVMIAPLKQPEVAGVTLTSSSSVRVSIQLSEVRAEKMISHIPVELRGTERPHEWSIAPSSVTVTVEGRPSLIEKFDAEKAGLKAYSDITNIFMTPVTLPVKTEILSGDFRVTRTEPQNVTITNAQ